MYTLYFLLNLNKQRMSNVLMNRATALCRQSVFVRSRTLIGRGSTIRSSDASRSRRDISSLYCVSLFDSDRLFSPSLSYQARWKRKDGNKWHGKERTPTKKQRKKYHRHLQTIQAEKERHGKPGSKAGRRREWSQATKNDLLNDDQDKEDKLLSDEYNMGDALLDDLMGNTVQGQPTPEPVYLGHKHRTYFNAVADQMEDYRKYQQQLQEKQVAGRMDLTIQPVELPSDQMISLAVRAFRDKNGTRRKPIGIIKVLQHVIQDLGVPVAALGEYSYTALLTCCQTPTEARRIFQMIREQGLAVSAYSWSILTDLYAKAADFEGCVAVQQEMLQAGIPPTLASYTSLLAACHKICNDGRVSHNIRSIAANMGWRKWQEMRIVGIDADVMAYGAILRLKAATGQPEEAVNLLEEMQRFGVKPTTLCFSSALRAVARSHATAIRYEKGASRRNRRREFLTQHHGKLAQHILILAESAGVEQDEGFVAALGLCAAAAGDVATAKAIYVASQIRMQDQFRTIGPNVHLARLRGEKVSDDKLTVDLLPRQQQARLGGTSFSSDGSLSTTGSESESNFVESDKEYERGDASLSRRDSKRKTYPSYGEREYGKDNRVLSAILHACAQSVDKNGVGTMWQGRENKGYMCVNSLRLIAAPKVPQYYDNSIPGQKTADNLTWSGEHTEGYRDGKRKSRKFEGVDVDDSGSTLDDLDEMFSGMYLDDDGRLNEEFRKSTPEQIWRLKYGDDWNNNNGDEKGYLEAPSASHHSHHKTLTEVDFHVKTLPAERDEEPKEELYFDNHTMRWKTRSKPPVSILAERELATPLTGNELVDATSSDANDKEMFFDYESMRWKTRTHQTTLLPQKDSEAVQDGNNPDAGSDSGSDNELDRDSNERLWRTSSSVEAEDRDACSLTAFESRVLSNISESHDCKEIILVSSVQDKKFVRRVYCTLPVKPADICFCMDLLIVSHWIDARQDNFASFIVPKVLLKEFVGFEACYSLKTHRAFLFQDEGGESDEDAFSHFFAGLLDEVSECGQEEVSEEEARELFLLMKDEYNEMITMSPKDLGLENLAGLGGVGVNQLSNFDVSGQDSSTPLSRLGHAQRKAKSSSSTRKMDFKKLASPEESKGNDFEVIVEKLKDEWRDQGFDLDEEDDRVLGPEHKSANAIVPTPKFAYLTTIPFRETATTTAANNRPTVVPYDGKDQRSVFEKEDAFAITSPPEAFMKGAFIETVEVVESEETEVSDAQLQELRQLLPAFSDVRLQRILRVFHKSLSDPPLLELILVVRENMPDYITSTWLKKMSGLTARFVLQKAAQDDLINTEILNGVLELQASTGSLDRAIAFHQTEYMRHGTEPTGYSDRLVLQMLLKNNRFSRALGFKQKIEQDGRSLDVKAYGSLVEYCSRRHQLGSSLLLLKECLSIHGTPPGEATLSKLRLMCRQAGLSEEIGLYDMIGLDPVEWLRHGEAELKREMSKKGRRDVQLARNQLVRL